jgi:hypothetical protein
MAVVVFGARENQGWQVRGSEPANQFLDGRKAYQISLVGMEKALLSKK